MRLRAKLLVAPALSTLLLIGFLGGSLQLLNDFRERSRSAQVSMMKEYAQVQQVESILSDSHIALYRTMAVISSLSDKKIQEIRSERQELLRLIPPKMKSITHAPNESQLRTIETQTLAYIKTGDQAIELSKESPNDQAMKFADQKFLELNKSLDFAISRVQLQNNMRSEYLENQAKNQSLALVSLGLLAVIACTAFSWRVQRRVVHQISLSITAMQCVADGNLNTQERSYDSDEIGGMIRSLDHMVSRLRDSVRGIRTTSESIHTIANEVASGNLDLSHRTESTATLLQQAGVDLDQLISVIDQTTKAAVQANQSAESAAAVAARGGDAADAVVRTMQTINDSSQKIATIISVIDGIAFQTNILALNAAVEAARAGEHGRGFAVVAAEVRGLAQRCAAAAKEVKSLIEASVHSVEAGAEQVHRAGSTMNEIVESVKEVAQLVEQITTATSKQAGSTHSLRGTMEHLDHMTQQNAALVEESAATAEVMRDQADRLRNVVGQFKL